MSFFLQLPYLTFDLLGFDKDSITNFINTGQLISKRTASQDLIEKPGICETKNFLKSETSNFSSKKESFIVSDESMDGIEIKLDNIKKEIDYLKFEMFEIRLQFSNDLPQKKMLINNEGAIFRELQYLTYEIDNVLIQND